MTKKQIEEISKNPDHQWVYIQKEVASLLRCTRQEAAVFLDAQSVPYYKTGRVKKYFLPDIIDALERTRYKT